MLFRGNAVFVPAALRLSMLLLLLANGLKAIVSDLLGKELWTDRTVCFYYCAEARVLALSGRFTFIIFVLKYVYAMLRHRKRCVLLSTRLKYSVQRSRDAIKTTTAGSNGDGGFRPASSVIDLQASLSPESSVLYSDDDRGDSFRSLASAQTAPGINSRAAALDLEPSANRVVCVADVSLDVQRARPASIA